MADLLQTKVRQLLDDHLGVVEPAVRLLDRGRSGGLSLSQSDLLQGLQSKASQMRKKKERKLT